MGTSVDVSQGGLEPTVRQVGNKAVIPIEGSSHVLGHMWVSRDCAAFTLSVIVELAWCCCTTESAQEVNVSL